MGQHHYHALLKRIAEEKKSLAVLIDPDKFEISEAAAFLKKIPFETTHLFVGGSTVPYGHCEATVEALKQYTNFPVFLFPGDYTQITGSADGILFLSLLSGRNPEYLIGQQIKSVPKLQSTNLEIVPTAYLLLDGGNNSAVAKVTETEPISQDAIEKIVQTALAGQYMGAKLIYLEAGSGAKFPVRPEIISAVKKNSNIPLLVGGGIRTEVQKQAAYNAGADLVVMGTVFEE
ncbi:putative glycerol-1-phosphate prenyltransferase [Ulvibacter sp. MAR_2010_11]|uniref:geranylgeranylglyceryl/heptaprenylglyceryl phosphate synthase n=1 Tax=Ulvibacter sp. MAR_2010_11 TaxID=1250229 RepID=UPI000C2BFC73|nr:geranylgeranylglyceryl/heptaprenylglyceryl phosphate synthase [Ulvibacter sp. MAR_2010_11]PKA82696.1 putative glycerol-1-phosphate prenyltransferase [Ulvibacter sp. MAR_2010_11]